MRELGVFMYNVLLKLWERNIESYDEFKPIYRF